MLRVYTLLIRVFWWLVPLIQPFAGKKFKVWSATRTQWQRDANAFEKRGKVVWFHCASVGEFEQARPVIEELKHKAPSTQIVVTFFSPSGYEVRKSYELADLVTYLPLDLPEHIRPFIDHVQPDLMVFVKYELWFNTMNELNKRRIPMTLVSAHFTDKHWTTQWPGIHLGIRMRQFDRIFTQTEASVNRLKSVDIDTVVAVGDTRVDRVIQRASEPFSDPVIEAFVKEQRVVVIGSNWPEDDEVLLPALREMKGVKFIVAPHEMNDRQLDRWRAFWEEEMTQWTEANEHDVGTKTVLYVDTIGMLSALYRFAEVAYIGGGFGKAVHNTLEAAVYGIPVVFGPQNKRFLEVQRLKDMGAGIEIRDEEQLRAGLDKGLYDATFRKEARGWLHGYFSEQEGASRVVAKWLGDRLIEQHADC